MIHFLMHVTCTCTCTHVDVKRMVVQKWNFFLTVTVHFLAKLESKVLSTSERDIRPRLAERDH